MVSIQSLLAFTAAAAVLIAIPGPSVLFVVGRSLALGWRGGLLTVVGNAGGVLAQLALVVIGVGALLAQSVVVFTIVKYAGAAYLAFLGVQAIRHGRRQAAELARQARGLDEPGTPVRSKALVVLSEGFFVGVSNPKAIVFFVAALPQFVDYSRGSVPLQLAALGTVFAVLALLLDGAWALAAGAARGWFIRRPHRVAQLSVAGGAMMIGLALWVALTNEKGTPSAARA